LWIVDGSELADLGDPIDRKWVNQDIPRLGIHDRGQTTMIKRLLARLGDRKKPVAPATTDASGNNAAARLKGAGRIPINIWGDVLLDGSPPQVRRVLTGQDAHESLLSFFYLAEILTLSEVVSAIAEKEAATGRPSSISMRYAELKQASNDPHNQLSEEILQVFIPTALFFKLVGQENTELCELGCTFFSAIDKMKICSSLLDAQLDFGKIVCAAVDHSDYFLRGALKLHESDNIVPYRDYAEWKSSTQHPFHLSRFVASYAVSSTDEFSEWLKAFGAFHIIDVVNLALEDFTTSNNGLRQIFFNFPKLIGGLEAAGWNVYLNNIAADYNSGQRCAVVKMFGIRQDLDERIGFARTLRAHSDLASALPMERMTEQTAGAALKRAEGSLTEQEWKALAQYKKHFPIWGGPVGRASSMDDVAKLMAAPSSRLNLHFESGQINYYIRQALGEPT
jgi:hypothetical protein